MSIPYTVVARKMVRQHSSWRMVTLGSLCLLPLGVLVRSSLGVGSVGQNDVVDDMAAVLVFRFFVAGGRLFVGVVRCDW